LKRQNYSSVAKLTRHDNRGDRQYEESNYIIRVEATRASPGTTIHCAICGARVRGPHLEYRLCYGDDKRAVKDSIEEYVACRAHTEDLEAAISEICEAIDRHHGRTKQVPSHVLEKLIYRRLHRARVGQL
jgi:hypothetical protein